jgi:Heparinase II/III-like protein
MIRTSWRSDASFLLFDVGPMGGWHGHLDALNLVYAPDGVMTVFDSTGGTYSASPFRTWAVSTASHNAVLVDGLNQFRPKDFTTDPVGQLPAATPKPVFQVGAGGVYACGWHVGGFGKDARCLVRHRREIGFRTTDGVVVVVDTLTPEDGHSHRYDLRWQLQTPTWQSSPDGRIILPQREGRTLMAVVPLVGGEEVHADSAVTTPEILGWDVLKSAAPVPALTVRHLRRSAGQIRFVTALIPGSLIGRMWPTVEVGKDGWRITLDGCRDPLAIRLDEQCRIGGAGGSTWTGERTTIP